MMIYLGIAAALALVLIVMGVLIGRATKKSKEIIIELPPKVTVEDETPPTPKPEIYESWIVTEEEALEITFRNPDG